MKAFSVFFSLMIFVGAHIGFDADARAQGFDAPESAAPSGTIPEKIDTNPLKIKSVTLSAESLESGGMTEVEILFTLPPAYHAYLEQFHLKLVSPEEASLSAFDIHPLTSFKDPLSKKMKKGAAGNATLLTVLHLPTSMRSGPHDVKAILTYQACTDDYCLFPNDVPVEFKITVTGGADDFIHRSLSEGWLYALLMIFLAGVLTSLTPCIFPLIPITLAIIGSHEPGARRRDGFFLSLAYVLGIAVTYSILGVIAAKTGALFGSLLGHPVVVTGIAVLFVLMGLSMYGLFEVKIPDRWAGRLFDKKWKKGGVGAFGAGLVAGVVASPCVGPVLVSILAYVAQTQDSVRGFVFLFVYALGLGQLFLVLGTFSQLTRRMPRSGAWMQSVKVVFGTVMILMALYYVYPVLPSGLFKSSDVTTTSLEKNFPNPAWVPYSEERLKQAAAEGRPVVLDFQADWCLACKELEHNTFSKPAVLAEGERFLWLSFDATKGSPTLDELKKRYRILGLPAVQFFDSTGKWRQDLTLTGFENEKLFLQRLRAVR